MKKLLLLGFIAPLFFLSCLTSRESREKEFNRDSKCYDSWAYKDLAQETEGKVLYFFPSHLKCACNAANFLVCRLTQGDTVAVLDKDFDGQLAIGALVKLSPCTMTNDEKIVKDLPFVLKPKFYCAIKVVYYAKITK